MSRQVDDKLEEMLRGEPKKLDPIALNNRDRRNYDKGYKKLFGKEGLSLEEQYKKETGEDPTWRYDREDLYSAEYVKWLEGKIQGK